MDRYIKLDVIGQGSNGNSVIQVKNLDDNKVQYTYIELCCEENIHRGKRRRTK
jgi:hypothetical protein